MAVGLRTVGLVVFLVATCVDANLVLKETFDEKAIHYRDLGSWKAAERDFESSLSSAEADICVQFNARFEWTLSEHRGSVEARISNEKENVVIEFGVMLVEEGDFGALTLNLPGRIAPLSVSIPKPDEFFHRYCFCVMKDSSIGLLIDDATKAAGSLSPSAQGQPEELESSVRWIKTSLLSDSEVPFSGLKKVEIRINGSVAKGAVHPPPILVDNLVVGDSWQELADWGSDNFDQGKPLKQTVRDDCEEALHWYNTKGIRIEPTALPIFSTVLIASKNKMRTCAMVSGAGHILCSGYPGKGFEEEGPYFMMMNVPGHKPKLCYTVDLHDQDEERHASLWSLGVKLWGEEEVSREPDWADPGVIRSLDNITDPVDECKKGNKAVLFCMAENNDQYHPIVSGINITISKCSDSHWTFKTKERCLGGAVYSLVGDFIGVSWMKGKKLVAAPYTRHLNLLKESNRAAADRYNATCAERTPGIDVEPRSEDPVMNAFRGIGRVQQAEQDPELNYKRPGSGAFLHSSGLLIAGGFVGLEETGINIKVYPSNHSKTALHSHNGRVVAINMDYMICAIEVGEFAWKEYGKDSDFALTPLDYANIDSGSKVWIVNAHTLMRELPSKVPAIISRAGYSMEGVPVHLYDTDGMVRTGGGSVVVDEMGKLVGIVAEKLWGDSPGAVPMIMPVKEVDEWIQKVRGDIKKQYPTAIKDEL